MSISFTLPRNMNRDCGRGAPRRRPPGDLPIGQAKGTVYVVAAGNESRNARQNRPAAYDEVITVSAMADYDGRGGGQAPRPTTARTGRPSATTHSQRSATTDLTST